MSSKRLKPPCRHEKSKLARAIRESFGDGIEKAFETMLTATKAKKPSNAPKRPVGRPKKE
ncbi:hypothetical protein NHP22001_14500 [Helicobacter sp. NHP22-001]|nr:hypothetical protein NHP22001_14500 [Helicobacter sp. NHP22-001]